MATKKRIKFFKLLNVNSVLLYIEKKIHCMMAH